MKYLRIGTDYYKICNVPLQSGDSLKTLIKWTKGEIITDHGKKFLCNIKRYDGFVTIPNHVDYQGEINFFYNQYEDLDHKLVEGNYEITITFLKHIFKDQYEIGIDYLTIIWQQPLQILPILCLVSENRNTGKTTFLNWLKLIYQRNMTINTNDDFRSRFNGDWTTKLIIGVDEVLLDRKEDSERIKSLSTAKSSKTENKGKDKVEGDFFGKFILCSNNEENFIQIDSHEIRYWVIKVNTLQSDDVNILKKLESEIPNFLYFLNNRKIKTEKRTRMWFTREQIYTPALDKVVKGNKTYLNREIKEIIVEDFVAFDVEILKYTASDLAEKLNKNSLKSQSFKISECLNKDYGLVSKNGSYQKYYYSKNLNNTLRIESETKKGRYFEFLKKDFFEIDVDC
jgi:hypothetical protein